MGARAEAIDDLDETTLEGSALASVARAREETCGLSSARAK
jgi:hypothetical protein